MDYIRKNVKATTMSWFLGALIRTRGIVATIPTMGSRTTDREGPVLPVGLVEGGWLAHLRSCSIELRVGNPNKMGA